jgi:hypothetical protein
VPIQKIQTQQDLRQQELLKEEFFNPEAVDTKKAA